MGNGEKTNKTREDKGEEKERKEKEKEQKAKERESLDKLNCCATRCLLETLAHMS